MIYLFVSIVYILYSKVRLFSISKMLFGLLAFSSIAAYLVGRQPDWEISHIFFVLYIVTLLFVLFVSYEKFYSVKQFDFGDINLNRLLFVERILTAICFILIVVDFYILINVFPLLFMGELVVQEYKNEAGAYDIISNIVPRVFISISHLLSPIGYVFIALHFFYLIKGNTGRAIKNFCLSLIMVLSGLIFMSRSSSVLYLLIYFFIFCTLYPIINIRLRKKIVRFFTISVLCFSVAFIAISNSRFSDYYGNHSLNKSIIDEGTNPVLFSICDYFGQWEEMSLIMMDRYKPEYKSWGLYNSAGIIVQIQYFISGADKVNEQREKKYDKIFGHDIVYFHGLITRLIYDFGYIGTFLFIVLFSLVVRRFYPRQGNMTFRGLIALPCLLPFPLMFFTGNPFGGLSYNLGIIFSIIVYNYIKKKDHIKHISSKPIINDNN